MLLDIFSSIFFVHFSSFGSSFWHDNHFLAGIIISLSVPCDWIGFGMMKLWHMFFTALSQIQCVQWKIGVDTETEDAVCQDAATAYGGRHQFMAKMHEFFALTFRHWNIWYEKNCTCQKKCFPFPNSDLEKYQRKKFTFSIVRLLGCFRLLVKILLRICFWISSK